MPSSLSSGARTRGGCLARIAPDASVASAPSTTTLPVRPNRFCIVKLPPGEFLSESLSGSCGARTGYRRAAGKDDTLRCFIRPGFLEIRAGQDNFLPVFSSQRRMFWGVLALYALFYPIPTVAKLFPYS